MKGGLRVTRVPGRSLCVGVAGRARVGAVVVAAVLFAWAVFTSGCGPASTDGGPTTGGVSSTAPSTTAPSTTAPPETTTTIPYASTTVPAATSTTRGADSVEIPAEGREVTAIVDAGDVIALTFDAAYDPAPLGDILEALTGAGIPATFFLTGEFAEDFPEHVAAIARAGFPIGNHSYSHPDFTQLDATSIRRELERTSDALAAAGAPDPRPLFRFPYGARDARVLAEVAAAGYLSVYWTVDTLDWRPERTPAEVRDVILAKARSGSIVLMHVGSRQTAEALPSVIMELQARGFRFVDLRSALLAPPGADAPEVVE